jgi:hypothetical protein
MVAFGAFGRNLASIALKVFPHLICFINNFYQFCTLDCIFKDYGGGDDDDAVNCVTVHKSSFPSTSSGHILR